MILTHRNGTASVTAARSEKIDQIGNGESVGDNYPSIRRRRLSIQDELCYETPVEEFSCMADEETDRRHRRLHPTEYAEAAETAKKSWWKSLMNKRPGPHEAYVPTKPEHIANVLSHGLAIFPAILTTRSMLQDTASDAQYLNALVYGVCYILLFTMSALYHCVFLWGKCRILRLYLHLIDRAVIYTFIAASYAPWLNLRETTFFGRQMRWLVWLMSAGGIFYQFKFHEKYKLIEVILYLFIGLFPSLAIMSMSDSSGVGTLIAGGAFYIIGIVIFKCDGIIPFAHAIWHVHVIIAAAFHVYAVRQHLIGPQFVIQPSTSLL